MKRLTTILLTFGMALMFALVSTNPAVAAEKKKTPQETVASAKALPKGKIDINTAGMEELMVLPGIGEVKAEAIMQARKKSAFKTADDLIGVSGIGEKTVQAIKPYLKFK